MFIDTSYKDSYEKGRTKIPTFKRRLWIVPINNCFYCVLGIHVYAANSIFNIFECEKGWTNIPKYGFAKNNFIESIMFICIELLIRSEKENKRFYNNFIKNNIRKP